jgi:hypothetical protein
MLYAVSIIVAASSCGPVIALLCTQRKLAPLSHIRAYLPKLPESQIGIILGLELTKITFAWVSAKTFHI